MENPPQPLPELSRHPQRAELLSYLQSTALGAADVKNHRFGTGEFSAPPAPAPLKEASPAKEGDLVALVEQGASNNEQAGLLGLALALSLEGKIPEAPEQQQHLAAQLVWLATHTPCDAWVHLDRLPGAGSAPLWPHVASLASLKIPGIGRAEALGAAAALQRSCSPVAKKAVEQLLSHGGDSLVSHVLGAAGPQPLSGEMAPRPRGAIATALLATTLVLFVVRAGRVLGRLALAYKRPARLTVTRKGLELSQHIELLGRVLRKRSMLVPFDNLASVTREIRFSRLGLYAGLASLVLGTYLGVGFLLDGLRVAGGSPTLLWLALLFILGGLLLDFALTSLGDNARGRCQVVVVPLKGRPLCIGGLDPVHADAMLSAIREQSSVASSTTEPRASSASIESAEVPTLPAPVPTTQPMEPLPPGEPTPKAENSS